MLVLPSVSEGFRLVVLEATALRHPWNRFEDEMREIVRGTLPARSAGDL